jgi:hypothetical protein
MFFGWKQEYIFFYWFLNKIDHFRRTKLKYYRQINSVRKTKIQFNFLVKISRKIYILVFNQKTSNVKLKLSESKFTMIQEHIKTSISKLNIFTYCTKNYKHRLIWLKNKLQNLRMKPNVHIETFVDIAIEKISVLNFLSMSESLSLKVKRNK